MAQELIDTAQRAVSRRVADGQPVEHAAEQTAMLLELGTPSGRGKPIAPAPLRQAHLVAAPMLVALVVLGAALFWLADTLAALTAIAVTVPFLILGMWPLFVSLRLRIKEKQEIALAVHRAKARVDADRSS